MAFYPPGAPTDSPATKGAVDPRNEGCKCDGTDDAAALQAMIDKFAADGGALIQIPRNSTLAFSKSPLMKPGIWIEGHGPGSVLKNLQTHANLDWRDGPQFGDGHPYTLDARNDAGGATFARYPIAATLKGASAIVPTGGTAAAALAALPVGAPCWVRTAAEWQHPSGGSFGSQPVYYVLTYVVANDGTNVTLLDPLEEDIASGYVSPISGTDPYMGVPWQVTRNNVLRNLTIDARRPWGGRGSAYGLRIEDIYLPVPTQKLAPCNAFQHAVIRRVRGEWSVSFAEVAMASRDVKFEEIQGKFRKVAGTAVGNIWKVGENSRAIRFRDCAASIGAAWDGAGFYPLVIQDCKDVIVEACKLLRGYAGGGTNNLIAFNAGLTTSNLNPARDVQLVGNIFDCGADGLPAFILVGDAAGKDLKAQNITLDRNSMYGALTVSKYWVNAQFSDGLIARANRVQIGSANITTGSTNVSIATDNLLVN